MLPALRSSLRSTSRSTTYHGLSSVSHILRPQRLLFSSSSTRFQPQSPTPSSSTANYVGGLFNVENKVIIVTGGSGGLGLAMAEALVHAGANVHCIDRADQPNDDFLAVQSRTGSSSSSSSSSNSTGPGTIHYHPCDICATSRFQSLISSIASQNSRLDGLITSAGVFPLQDALSISIEDMTSAWSVLYAATFTAAQATAREMIKHNCGGSMAFIASMSGLVANKGFTSTAYNAPKASVIQLARNLAQEWSQHGIRVNALCPGYIATKQITDGLAKAPGIQEELERQNMLGRLSKPEEFGAAGLFLLSQASAFMTGSHLVIDGGHTAW